jgi:hypothetical protein
MLKGVFMKKFVVVLVLLAVVAFSVSAQTGFFVGGKLGFGPGFSSLTDESKAKLAPGTDDKGTWAFTFGAVAGYTFMPKLSVVSGLDIYFNQGTNITWPGNDWDYVHSSADIPLLIRFEFIQNLKDRFNFGVEGGANISIPLTATQRTGAGDFNFDSNGVIFGLKGGLVGSYDLGPGRFTAGLHLLFDFSPVEADVYGVTAEWYSRRQLILSAGYEFTLGGLRKR